MARTRHILDMRPQRVCLTLSGRSQSPSTWWGAAEGHSPPGGSLTSLAGKYHNDITLLGLSYSQSKSLLILILDFVNFNN